MAYRALFNSQTIRVALLQRNTLLYRSSKRPNVRFLSNIFQTYRPVQGWSDGTMASYDAIMHHYGVIPILVITFVGFACEVMYTIRNAFTRDDVCFVKGPMKCELIETRPGYEIPPAKNLVFKQKYVLPKGLIEAQFGHTGCPSEEKPKNRRALGLSVAGTAVVATTAIVLYSGILA